MGWWSLLIAAISGGLLVKLLDYAYTEYRRRAESSKSAKDFINRHLDPILKAADELVGKMRSLAQSDFQEVLKAIKHRGTEVNNVMPIMEVVFLLAQFWARIQILRMESVYVNISSNEKGKQLIEYIRALEATKTRLVDRAWQRGIGEALIRYENDKLRSINYYEFIEKYLSEPDYRNWFKPLILSLEKINNKKYRQRMLLYGVIVNSLIDTLDKNHLVTRGRPGWSNKLSEKSKKELHYRVFPIYLKFAKTPERYYEDRSRKTKIS